MRSDTILLVVALTGCAEPGTVTLLSGFDFEWSTFNHRLSFLSVQDAGGGDLVSAVVGGTSTTGVEPTYADACDPETCKEFPFTDTANVHATHTTLTEPGLTSAAGSVTFGVFASGTDAAIPLTWETAPGEITPVIAGFAVDTRQDVEACYDPAFGWLPTHLALAVEADGSDVVAIATFTSGLSLEAERACLDGLAGEARVTVTVDVLVLAGVDTELTSVQQSASYELGSSATPDAQEPPTAVLTGDAVAWQSLDWSFHNGDRDGRGAYLRSLGFSAGDATSAWATNYSPGTQLSGFDFAFDGIVVSVAGERTRSEVSAEYTPVLDGEGAAVAVGLE